jgi:hypothetical protein
MRTKTLLLTAALTAAGVATSMAQVYSVNMVGYINQSVPVGFSMIANHLNGSPDNKVTTLLPTPPNRTAIFKFDRGTGGYISITYLGGWEGDDLDMTLGPGEGAFMSSDVAFTATFVGEVQLSSALPIQTGFQIISSVLPQSLALDGLANDGSATPPAGLGFPVQNGDEVYQFNAATGGYISDSFLGGAWEGDSEGAAPVPDVGESFWVNRRLAAAGTWNRNFVVGVD